MFSWLDTVWASVVFPEFVSLYFYEGRVMGEDEYQNLGFQRWLLGDVHLMGGFGILLLVVSVSFISFQSSSNS